jgi:outer membrane lipoprotein SlyB
MGAGLIRTTTDGIHGPELQFMGRSLPVTTGIVPYLGALAGGVAGVRSKRPILGGVGGGMAGLAAGQVAGQLLESERRRRNAIENESDIERY